MVKNSVAQVAMQVANDRGGRTLRRIVCRKCVGHYIGTSRALHRPPTSALPRPYLGPTSALPR